jgi:hypothetical protein
VVAGVDRDELVSGLVRIGEKELTGEDEAEVDAYFAPDFRFHGPDGRELDYQGLKGYFAALRAAFDDLAITRGIVIVDGNYVACQTSIAGRFVREFTHSPVGPLPRPGTWSCSTCSTSSATTAMAASPRSGSRPTTAASCGSSAPRGR